MGKSVIFVSFFERFINLDLLLLSIVNLMTNSKDSPLPPTGVMLLGAALPESYGLPKYSKEQIELGIKRDYKLGKSEVRRVAAELNSCNRSGIASSEVTNEGDVSLETIDIARRGFDTYPLENYPSEAQDRINSGRQGIDEDERKRKVKVKFLNYDGLLGYPLICTTARRESKLTPKCGKFLERLLGVMQHYESIEEEPEISFKKGIERLFELEGDIYAWRNDSEAQKAPSKVFRTCVTDFSGTTFIINPPEWIRKLENSGKDYTKMEEELNEEITERMKRIVRESTNREGFVEITSSNNFPTKKDRAYSIVIMDYSNFAINEVRINTREHFVLGKLGGKDIAHHHYKLASKKRVLEYHDRFENPVFQEIAGNLVNLVGARDVKSLFE